MLIKESIVDDTIIDYLNVHKIELWNTGGKPKYWTVLFFTSDRKDFPEQVSKVMVSDPDNGGNKRMMYVQNAARWVFWMNK